MALALFAGIVAGAIPFCLPGLEGSVPGYLAFALVVAAGVAGYRAPVRWCLGIPLGILGGWLFWVVVIAANWKLLLYVLAVYERIYLVAGLALVVTLLLGNRRVTSRA